MRLSGLWDGQAFYWWAIGWVLVWGAGIQRGYVRHYLGRPPPDGEGRQ